MARRKSRFQRFKSRSDQVSLATGLASFAAFVFRRKRAALHLLKLSAVSGLASAIPSRRGLKRVFGRGKKLSRLERLSLGAKSLGAVSNALLLTRVGFLPSLAVFGAQSVLELKAEALKSRRRKVRRR